MVILANSIYSSTSTEELRLTIEFHKEVQNYLDKHPINISPYPNPYEDVYDIDELPGMPGVADEIALNIYYKLRDINSSVNHNIMSYLKYATIQETNAFLDKLVAICYSEVNSRISGVYFD